LKDVSEIPFLALLWVTVRRGEVELNSSVESGLGLMLVNGCTLVPQEGSGFSE